MKEGQELMLEYKRARMKGYIQVTPIDARFAHFQGGSEEMVHSLV